MSKNLKWPTGVIAESMGLAGVLDSRETGSERGDAQGQGPLLGNIVYWGQEEPEPFKEEMKEWSFTLLQTRGSIHSGSSLRGSDLFISGVVKEQQEFKRVTLSWGQVNWGKLRGVWMCLQAPGELALHVAVRVANQASLPLVDFIIQNG